MVAKDNLIEKTLKVFFLNLFLLPIYPDNLKPTCIGLFCLVSIFYGFKNEIFVVKKLNILFLTNISIFLLLLFSILYSTNLNVGFKNIFRALPLFIFPFVFLLLKENQKIFSEQFSNRGKLLFYISTLILFISFFFIFLYRGNVTKNYFLNYSYRIISQLGRYSIHPIYASLYTCIALIFSMSLYKIKKYKILIILGNILLVTNLILLSRKSAILIMILYFIIYIFCFSKINLKRKFVYILSILFLAIIVVKYIPDIGNRFKDISNVFNNNTELSSSNLRLTIYKVSISAIKENPILGYGIGDVEDVLTKLEKNYDYFKGNYFNSHNQFLSYTLSNGIIGLVVFIYFLFRNFTLTNYGNFEYTILLLLFSFFMCIENILERQNGIILFSFFVNYFSFSTLINQKNE